jgi:signal-transduction protein with cAMP-binding, CBS, and nucleotidyltransferase domain
MAEEGQFFRPVKDFCQRTVVTCGPDDTLVDVVRIMREKNISSVVVCENKLPSGIMTDRDLRNKVVACGTDPSTLAVRAIMNRPLSVIGENDLLYEALYRMSREKIHRLAVVDDQGKLSGIITDSDIIRLQSHSPHQLVLDIEKAQDLDELRAVYSRIPEPGSASQRRRHRHAQHARHGAHDCPPQRPDSLAPDQPAAPGAVRPSAAAFRPGRARQRGTRRADAAHRSG